MRYRLVALDIDGTILDNQGQLSPGIRQVISEIRTLGVQVVLATGRRLINTLPFAEALALQGPLVVHNGAVVFGQQQQKVLVQTGIDLKLAQIIHGELGDRLLNYVVYTGESAGEEILAPIGTWTESEDLIDHYLGESALFVNQITLEQSPVRFSIVDRPTKVDQFYQFLKTYFNDRLNVMLFRARDDRWRGIEIIPGNSSKKTGLAWVADSLGIQAKEVLALGDNVNDVEMIRWAGLGVAMENGSPALKAHADRIAPPNDQDGAAIVLEELFLTKGD